MTHQNICTPQELKEFANNSIMTINELSNFIESKTNQEYIIIERGLAQEVSKQLFDNTLHIFEINKFLNGIWAKIVSTNNNTKNKWEKTLKRFEVK